MKSLGSHLLFLLLTLGLCCVLYPAALYGIARVIAPTASNGNLIDDAGTPRGSRLIAQPFTSDGYFWPRPSAAGYNGAASGASNWGASNPKLRDRVARQLGPMVVYKVGSKSAAGAGDKPRTPQQDIAAWVAANPERAVEKVEGDPAAAFFDLWLSDPANADKAADLEPVIADLVTTSGSGLDPHVTVRNALSVYQLDRVAKKRGVPTQGVADLVRAKSFTPLSGLVGEPLVNVLELNVELDERFPMPAAR